MNTAHKIDSVAFADDKLVVRVDGVRREFKLHEVSRTLEKASAAERGKFEISPSGYGIHWPLVDEDLSIDGLLGISHHPLAILKKRSPSVSSAHHSRG